MGLIFAWALMGLPLAYAIWVLVQGRNEPQLANHTRQGPDTSQTLALGGSTSQSSVARTNTATANSPVATQPTDSFTDQLATLQTRVIDVLAGYRTMQEKAEPEIKPLVSDYIGTHTRHEQALAERLTELGHKADEDGSFFSIIQESVVRVRSMFTDLGANIAPQIIDGENSLIDLYRKLLERTDLETDRELLQGQMRDLAGLIDRTEKLKT